MFGIDTSTSSMRASLLGTGPRISLLRGRISLLRGRISLSGLRISLLRLRFSSMRVRVNGRNGPISGKRARIALMGEPVDVSDDGMCPMRLPLPLIHVPIDDKDDALNEAASRRL
jgi:hypothetical protein